MSVAGDRRRDEGGTRDGAQSPEHDGGGTGSLEPPYRFERSHAVVLRALRAVACAALVAPAVTGDAHRSSFPTLRS